MLLLEIYENVGLYSMRDASAHSVFSLDFSMQFCIYTFALERILLLPPSPSSVYHIPFNSNFLSQTLKLSITLTTTLGQPKRLCHGFTNRCTSPTMDITVHAIRCHPFDSTTPSFHRD